MNTTLKEPEKWTRQARLAGLKSKGLKSGKICLKCGKKFPSTGPYNRICEKCNSVNKQIVRSEYKLSATGRFELLNYDGLVAVE